MLSEKGKKVFLVILAVVILIVLILIPLTVFKVKTGEVAIISHFGEVVRVEGPGLHFKNPFTESKQKMEIKERTVKFGLYSGADVESISVSTKDMQTITLDVAVSNVITDPMKLYLAFTGNHLESMMIPRIRDAVQSQIAKYTIEEFVAQRDSLADAIFKDISESFSKYGIELTNVAITDHDFSDAYDAAVEAKKIAEQDKLAEETRQATLKMIKEKEVELAELEIQKKQHEAEANKKVAESITNEILLKMFLEKWDGKMPLVVGSEGATLLDLTKGR
jgi:regulator of protease activity HflC (stomatin/prohibitin superfamily)